MTDKPWYASRAVWGGIIAVLSAIAGAFGYMVTPEIQGELAAQITAIGGAVGGLLAVYGRVKATKSIK